MAALIALGFALACPWVTRVTCGAVAGAARPLQPLPVQMAAAGVARSLGITGVAVAAMMLAMAMNVGVRTMVRSFRSSLDHWLGQRFAADVFVGPELLVNHKIDATLDPAVERGCAGSRRCAQRDRVPRARRSVRQATTMLVGTDVPRTAGRPHACRSRRSLRAGPSTRHAMR